MSRDMNKRESIMRAFRLVALGIVALLSALPATSSSAKLKVLRGVVTDEAESPVPNVVIQLACHVRGKELTLGRALSNADGRFELKVVLQHECELKVTAPGFAPMVRALPDNPRLAIIDVGAVRLRVSCSGPGVICDESTPTEVASHPQFIFL